MRVPLKFCSPMLDKIVSEIESLETYDTDISIQMENFVQQNFETHMGKKIEEGYQATNPS